MLDIRFIRDNQNLVRDALKNKNRKPVDLEKIGALFESRTRLRGEADALNRKKKEASDARDSEAGKKVKEESQKLEEELKRVEAELHALLI